MLEQSLFFGCVAVFVAVAAATDAWRRRIPNWLTVPAAFAGLAFHALAPAGWGLATATAGAAIGFALLLGPWLLGGGGAGDVKLLTALGAWLGPVYLLFAFGLAIAFSAAAAMTILAWTTLSRGWRGMRRRLNVGAGANAPRRRMLPFAVPVAGAAACVLAWISAKGVL